jgi:hypothetical protein
MLMRSSGIELATFLLVAQCLNLLSHRVPRKRVSETENFTNLKVRKSTAWAKSNKINFNEGKSKTMLISRRKRKEGKESNAFLETNF